MKKQTNICKMCFKEIKNNSFHFLVNNKKYICSECMKKLEPKFYEYRILGYDTLSIYKYDDVIKNKIFEYKGCEDLELNNIFISFLYEELKIRYKNFVIVPVPSYKEKDEKRGYNHVIEIFKILNLEIINCIVKTENIDQKELNFKERQNISKFLTLNKDVNLDNKKILLVDDIITTGASVKACIKLLEKYKFKELKILTIAKRIL